MSRRGLSTLNQGVPRTGEASTVFQLPQAPFEEVCTRLGGGAATHPVQHPEIRQVERSATLVRMILDDQSSLWTIAGRADRRGAQMKP